MIARLLIVDDEEVITFAFRAYFERQGFAVDVGSTLHEGLSLLAERDYDVVVADLRLGGTDSMEGLDVIRAARSRSDRTVILVLTAYRSAAVDASTIEAGANALLQKPKPLQEVLQTIRTLLVR